MDLSRNIVYLEIMIIASISTIAVIYSNQFEIFAQQLGDGHNMPTSSIGDRQIMFNFTTEPSELQAGSQLFLDFALMDNKTGKNVPHTTYLTSILKDETRLFTGTLHSHDGQIKVQFVPSDIESYKINANYDLLSASYVSDFGSPIKVDGNVFLTPGDYKVIVEVTGVDFDNLFLPEPIKYEFQIKVNP